MKKNNSLFKLGLALLAGGLIYKAVKENKEEIDQFVKDYSEKVSDKAEEVGKIIEEKAEDIKKEIE